MANVASKKLLGQILVEEGKITEEQLEKALGLQKASNELLGYVLVHMGFVTDKDIIQAYSKQIDVPFVDLEDTQVNLDAVRLVPREVVLRHRIIPIKKNERLLTVAMVNPLNVFAVDDLRQITGLNIKSVIAPEKEILKAIDQYYRSGLSVSEAISDITDITAEDIPTGSVRIAEEEEEEEINIGELRELGEEAPIIRMVNAVVMQAIRDRATDIHIEPQERELRVRYRVDGLLHEAMTPPKRLQAAIISRIKIMS
ncbi:MAG: type II secretion system protein GspE, partial [Armatimonadetes bacterium CG07_land_8_20_14_0_80_40_9]